MKALSPKRQSIAASIYKTFGVNTLKYLTDIDRASISTDYQHYVELGGILTHDLSYNQLKKYFPRGV